MNYLLLIQAMNLGSVSVSSLFYSCGFLVPIFAIGILAICLIAL